MIEICGSQFYLDLNKMYELVRVNEKPNEMVLTSENVETTTTVDNNQIQRSIKNYTQTVREVDIVKYEFIKDCISILFDFDEEIDQTLGIKRALDETSLGFKLAFNTLTYYNILKEI